jgi:imidazolonepropionase-like amidohydrolase
MMRAILLLTAVAATTALTPPVGAQGDVILVRGGTVHTATGAPISNGSVLITGGKIVAVGTNVTAPPGAKIVDATGKTVIPGMIDNHSHIGARPTDLNDSPMLIGPQHRFIDALDWNDPDFQDAVEGGVTTVVTGPGSGENVSGMAAVVKTFGTDYTRRMLLEKGGMKFAMGQSASVPDQDAGIHGGPEEVGR